MRLQAILVALTLPTFALPAYSQSAEDISPFVADSFKCQSKSDRGATCDRTVCTNAPANYAYIKDTLKVREISGNGRNRRCNFSLEEMRDVEFALPSGVKATMQMPGKICVNAHAETGSGVRNISRTAWAQCELTGQWVQYR